MRPVHQVDGHVAGEPRGVKVEGRDKSQASAGNGPDPHTRRDTRVAQIELPADGEPQQRRLEAGRPAGGKELLGIRPWAARPAHLSPNVEVDVDPAVRRRVRG